jgi:transcriptional regulator with XRE-family HTH domain
VYGEDLPQSSADWWSARSTDGIYNGIDRLVGSDYSSGKNKLPEFRSTDGSTDGGYMSQVKGKRALKIPVAPGAAREVTGQNGSRKLGAYLRRLREGYGYTLRKVEERAMALGEAIDNSQLSRFEKGKAVPSFEKLRALARIFNISVQNFSDVLDLEQYESLKPESEDFEELLRDGETLFAKGDHGRAFVTFERALEVAEESGGESDTYGKIMDARWRMATALKVLGKLSMAEYELREILKHRHQLGTRTKIRTLLQLSHVYRELADRYLASVMARECLDLAAEEGDLKTQASVLNTLANIHYDEGEAERAFSYYQRALEVLEALGGHEELRATLLTNLGGCLVALHRFEEGVAQIRDAHGRAVERGFRRVAALAMTRLAEAYLQRGSHRRAREAFAESDSLASRPDGSYHDILFLNAFRRWEMARQNGNATREKITFGRLRHLRSLIERRFPEVEEFDRYVERTRRKYGQAS